ncbi:MAG: SRPBCC domain-containing protein [Acidimicrobiales bacterium]
MTDKTLPLDLSTLDARKGSIRIDLSEDGSSYRCVRVFGAPPERVFRAFTDPADLRVWFPSGAPEGSEMTVCESDPIEGGKYHYAMVIPDYGPFAWHGTYNYIDRPDRLDADEWFVMGDDEPTGAPSAQTLTFEPTGDGFTLMTMQVAMPEPEDPEEFMEQSAAGLTASLSTMDELISN